VRDVSEVVQVGDEVSVRVLSVEGDKRLSLTMKSEDGDSRRRGGGGDRGGDEGGYSDRRGGDRGDRW